MRQNACLKVSKVSKWLFLCNHYSCNVLIKYVAQLVFYVLCHGDFLEL